MASETAWWPSCVKNAVCRVGFMVSCLLVCLLIVASTRKGLQNVDNTLKNHQKPSSGQDDNGLGHPQTHVTKDSTDTLHVGSNSQEVEVLGWQAKFIRDAVWQAHFTSLTTSAREPGCMGNRLPSEVEDILCIPRPDYLPEVKNPCWWDLQSKTSNGSTLRCLPYFYILGCGKCGSSDLWDRITSHPHAFRIAGTMHKEAKWWAWGRYGHTNFRQVPIRNFIEYTNNFTKLATSVKESLSAGNSSHKYYITGDGSPSVLWDFRGWVNISQNRGLKRPQVLTPHLIRHFYPDPKFIVILRNPTDRLYSDYFFLNNGTDALSFHTAVLKAISILSECIRERSVRECFFDNNVYLTLPLRLHYLFYSLYVEEWLKVFPAHSFLFIQNEEYSRDIKGILQRCIQFLGLETLSDQQMEQIAKKDHRLVGTRKAKAGPMMTVTRLLLDQLTRPSRKLLAQILNDRKFSWE